MTNVALETTSAEDGVRTNGSLLREPSEDVSKLNIYRKIGRIIAESHRLAKPGWNDHFSFAYTPHDLVVEMIRDLCAKYHLVVLQEPLEWARELKFTEKQHLTRVKYQYTVINADNPEDRFERHAWGEGLDGGDKGFNKCSTIADKFFYFRLFQIPTGDDPDAAGASKADTVKQNKGQCSTSRPSRVPSERKDEIKCENCGNGVFAIHRGGGLVSIERILAASQKEHGKKLCANCQIALRKSELSEARIAQPSAQPHPERVERPRGRQQLAGPSASR